MHRLIVQNLMGMTAALFLISAATADEQKVPVTLAVVGSPIPDTAIGDARHCPLKIAPVAKPGGDRVEFSLAAREPASITLTARRGGSVCGGSLYIVPENGLGYAARLTPGDICAAQLFRIDPHAKLPVQLMQTDNHPELDELVCATQQGSPGTSRLSVGRNSRSNDVRIEIGHDGDCGKFDHLSPTESGIELPSGVPQWVRLKFRLLRGFSGGVGGSTSLSVCDLSVKFTPIAGAAYLIDSGGNWARCEVRLLKADAAGPLSITPVERAGDANCKPTN